MEKLLDNRIVRTIGILILAVAFVIVGSVIGQLVLLPVALIYDSENMLYILQFLSMGGIWLLCVLFFAIRKDERRFFKLLFSKSKGNSLKYILGLGVPFGIGINLLATFIAIKCGNIHIHFSSANMWLLLAYLVAIFVQSSAEEAVARWFIYQKLRAIFVEYPIVPIFINATVFSLLHVFNEGITIVAIVNIALVGILYSFFIYYYDCFWGAVLAHTGWNFCQSIIMGLPNSGAVMPYSLYRLDDVITRNGFAYDTVFGIEGSWLAMVILAVSCVVIFILGRKHGGKNIEGQKA